MATTTEPAPSAPASQTRVPQPAGRRIRVPQLALGLLLVAGAALAFVLVNAASVDRQAVLALADDVGRGQVIAREDLQVVHVGSDDAVALTPLEQVERVVGRTATADLPAGSLVVAEQLTTGASLTPGAGVVGLSLAPGQYPTPALAVGDQVTVVEVSDGRDVLVEAAEVVSVESVGRQGQRFVSLLTGEEPASAVATAAAGGEVRLVLIATDETGGER